MDIFLLRFCINFQHAAFFLHESLDFRVGAFRHPDIKAIALFDDSMDDALQGDFRKIIDVIGGNRVVAVPFAETSLYLSTVCVLCILFRDAVRHHGQGQHRSEGHNDSFHTSCKLIIIE